MKAETVAGFQLSPQQEELWLEQQDDSVHRVSSVVSVEGRLDAEALHEALLTVASRHEALRTTFHKKPGMKVPFQIIHERLPPSWNEGDLLAPFDFERGPLVRASLLALGDERHVLTLSISGLIADAASARNLLGEAIQVYAGDAGSLPPEPLQYADFAAWANDVLASTDEDAAAGKAFWRDQTSFPAPQLPLSARVPSDGPPSAGAVAIKLDPAAARALDAIGLFAALQVLVCRLSGQHDFAIRFLLDGRGQEETKSAIGLYARAVPIPGSFEGNPRFSEVKKRASSAVEEAAQWKDYLPILGAAALPVGFEIIEAIDETSARGATFTPGEVSSHLGGFSAKLSVTRSSGASSARLFYDRRLFRDDDMARFARSFEILVAGAAADPSAEIERLPILGEEDKRMIAAFRAAEGSYPGDRCLHHLFEEQARRVPSRAALACGGRVLTYTELNARSNQLAHLLEKRGVSADTTVGLCVERSAEMIIALLGILKAGGAYVPLLADHPKARLARQLAEVEAPVLVTLEKHLGGLPDFGGSILCLDRDSALLDAEATGDPARRAGPESLAYVIYTSGSTGVPKGVAIRHENLVNYTHALCRRLDLHDDEGLHFATVSTIAADLGNTCVFPALVSGGCLHVIRHEVSMDGRLFAAYLEEHPIDVLKITPSHLGALMDAAGPDRRVLPRRALFTGGEASTWELSRRIREGGCVHINHYGPTETTIGSLTYGPVKDDEPAARFAQTVPIGRPIANTEVHIVDAHLSPVPVGAPGELLIGGAGLSRGYVHQAEQTAERFIKHPFSTDPEARLYRTSDRARFLPDGSVEFLGRVDHQVKIRGFRVELGEIEGVLRKDAAIRQAIVVVREDTPGDPRLVAYVVPTRRPAPTIEELRAFLQKELPDYMIPSIFVVLPALPLTPNGKIDRKALPAPDKARALESTFLAPRGPTEEKVALVWAEVLRLDRVGANDNFFELGGHSLLATQVISRVRKDFELVELRLGSLFDRPTVAGMAKVIDELLEKKSAEMDRMLAELNNMSEEEAERLAREG